jgi:type I restriction enzyme S subunit
VNGKAFKASDWSTTGVPIIRIQNLNGPDKPFNYWAGSLDDQVRVKSGDLLFAWSGTPGTSFGAHLWRGGESILNQHIFRCDIDVNAITPEWARFVVNTQLDRLIDLLRCA